MLDKWGKYCQKRESLYNIEQEGNHGWLWNVHLNRTCSPGGTLLSLSNIRNIDQFETLFVIILNLDQWIRCCLEFFFSTGNYKVQNSKTGWVALVDGLTRNVNTNCMK